eukprot:3845072-Pleurochrysis_carterae.AAC.1
MTQSAPRCRSRRRALLYFSSCSALKVPASFSGFGLSVYIAGCEFICALKKSAPTKLSERFEKL